MYSLESDHHKTLAAEPATPQTRDFIKDAYATTDTPSLLSKSDQQELAKLEAAKQKNNTRLQELKDHLGNMQQQHEKLFGLLEERRRNLSLQAEHKKMALALQEEINTQQKDLQFRKSDQLHTQDLSYNLDSCQQFLAWLKTKGVHAQQVENHLAATSQYIQNLPIMFSSYKAYKKEVNGLQQHIQQYKQEHRHVLADIPKAKNEAIPPIKDDQTLIDASEILDQYKSEKGKIEKELETILKTGTPQEILPIMQKRLDKTTSCLRISNAISRDMLETSYAMFERCWNMTQDQIQEHIGQLEPKQIQQQIEALDKDINIALDSFGIKPSKRLSQAEQIKNAKKLSKIRLVRDTKKSIQDIESKNQNIGNKIRQLTSKNTFSES